MTSHTTRRLATSITHSARRTAGAEPTIRGADWRLAVVADTAADGTITTTDGIVVRRLESYQAPAPQDQIVITRSGAGNWLAAGRTVRSSAPAGAWTTIPLANGFRSPHPDFGTAQYRIVTLGGADRVELRGAVTAPSGGVTKETTWSKALPAKARPSVIRTFLGRRVYSAETKGAAALQANPDGTLSVFGSTGANATTWFAVDSCYYDL